METSKEDVEIRSRKPYRKETEVGKDYAENDDSDDSGGPKRYGYSPKPPPNPPPNSSPKPSTSAPDAGNSCTWNAWGPWSSAGQTCGPTSKKRTRNCVCNNGTTAPGNCSGDAVETENLKQPPCITCTMSEWSSWSSVTKTCGDAVKTRHRDCNCSDGSKGTAEQCGSTSSQDKEEEDAGLDSCPEPITTPNTSKKWEPTKKWEEKTWSTTWSPDVPNSKRRRRFRRRRM